MRIACLLADGFEEIEAIGTIDLLRRCDVIVDLVGYQNREFVTGAHGIVIKTETPYEKLDPAVYDGLLIPGGGKQSATLRNDTAVLEMARSFYGNDKWLMAICAGPTVFGAAGLLNNIHYTSFPGTEVYIRDGIRENRAAVVDGKIITGAGAGAVFEFAFAIIEALFGTEKKIEMQNRTVFRSYER